MPLLIHVQFGGHRVTAPSGTGVYFGTLPNSAPITGSIATRAQAKITGDIGNNVLSAPANVMTRNAGNGTIEVRWDASAGPVDHYDVYICSTPSGIFTKANLRPILIRFAKIPNIPFGTTVYTKVRAVDINDNEGPLSALAVDAIVARATTRLRFTGLVGDQVNTGTVFAAIVNDELIAVRTLAGGVLA